MFVADYFHHQIYHNKHCYRPQRSCSQGNIFTPFCHSVHRGGLPQCMLGYQPPPPATDPPGADTHIPPGADTPPEQTSPQTRHPPGTRPPGTSPPGYGLRAAGTHPTGMHSCLYL